MKKISINIGGALSYAFIQWFIITYISREISNEAAGLYALYLAIFSPAAIFCAFGLRNQIATDVNYQFNDTTYNGISILGSIIFIIFSLVFLVFEKINLILSIIFIIKIIEVLSEKIYGEWIRGGLSQYYGYSRIYKAILTLSMFAVCIFIKIDKYLILFVYPVSYLIVYLLYDLRKKYKLDSVSNNFSYSELKKLLVFSLPIVVSAFIVSANVSIPKIVLSNYTSIDFVATYTLLIYFGSIAIIPLMSAFPVYLADFAKESKDSKRKKISYLIGVYSIIFFLFMLFFSDIIMKNIYHINNYQYIDILISGLIGVTQIYMVWLSFLLTSKRKFKILYKSNFINLISISFLSLILGYYFGITGILIAVLISNSILLVINNLNLSKEKISYDK